MQNQQHHQPTSNASPKEHHSPVQHTVIADHTKVYDGPDDHKASLAFLQAGKNGAREVRHLVNGKQLTISRALPPFVHLR